MLKILIVEHFQPVPLFTKLEPKQITEWKLRFGAADTNTGAKVEKSEVKKSKKGANY